MDGTKLYQLSDTSAQNQRKLFVAKHFSKQGKHERRSKIYKITNYKKYIFI